MALSFFIIIEKLLLLRKDNNEVDLNVSVRFAFLNFPRLGAIRC